MHAVISLASSIQVKKFFQLGLCTQLALGNHKASAGERVHSVLEYIA